jgi:arabinogalactan endo-1,4-beta-galactosidase
MKKMTGLLLLVLIAVSCGSDDKSAGNPPVEDAFIRAADMSFLPEIEAGGAVYKNNGQPEDALVTLKDAGCNTIRIRLWKNPANGHSGMAEVKALAARVKAMGMKVWLTVHYSDTWADPGSQIKPAQWEGLGFDELKAAATAYTEDILTQISPDIIQIGNETNSGFLFPEGNLIGHETQFLGLVTAISATIRDKAPDTKIMLHYAGIGDGAAWFFSKVNAVDYDYIGLSYYPIWHGKEISALQATINALGQTYNKEVVVAETAYPFTLGWNDWTNNVVGSDDQLIPAYPATADGQKNYLLAVRDAVENTPKGAGFAYWGGEWIAFRGPEATNGSAYENQALWDFDTNGLPVLQAFNK